MGIGFQVTFDANDPAALGAFWALALGYVEQPPPSGFDNWLDALRALGYQEAELDRAYALVDPAGVGPRLYFQKVPEGKTAKNRVHLDVNIGAVGGRSADPAQNRKVVDEHVARLVAAGATQLCSSTEHDEYCVVMQDPEGNEFCVQ
jgi:hypothetical protein